VALMAGTALVAGPVGRLADRSRRRAVMAAIGDPAKWRRTENNAIWVDQDELEELAEANEVRDEASKANIRLGSASTESTAEIKARSSPNAA
jgi:hypothetical protein